MTEERYAPSTAAYEQSEDIGELAKALCEFQGALEGVSKDKEVEVRTESGGTYRFWYADLASVWAAVRPLLKKCGLSVVQVPSRPGGGAVDVVTQLAHTSGQWLRGRTSVPVLKDKRGVVSPQAVGSAITYAKRYALVAFLGIPTEDDDGRKADGDGAPQRAARRGPKTNRPDLLQRLSTVNVHWKDVEVWLGHSVEEITEDEAKNLDEIGLAIHKGRDKEDFFAHPGQKLAEEYEQEGMFE